MHDDLANAGRRRLIKLGTVAVLGLSLPAWARAQEPHRTLSLLNTHTGEGAFITYWEQGRYLPAAMAEINRLLRDHRNGEIHRIDAGVIDVLHGLQRRLNVFPTFHVISGYRSAASNARLRREGGEVAVHSLHMEGKALDIYLPKVALRDLHRAALDLRAGGVGNYPRSNFIHVDVGRVRRWQGT